MMSKKNKIGILLAVVIPILCLTALTLVVLLGNKGPKYEITSESIKVKGGGYSATIPVADITEANVLEKWPSIALRTNGLGTNKVNMGHFRLKNGENCMMFIHEDGGPLLEMRTVDGQLYYLNCATKEETLEMIDKVKAVTTVKMSAVSRHCEASFRENGRSNPDKELHSWIASSCLLAMTGSASKITML